MGGGLDRVVSNWWKPIKEKAHTVFSEWDFQRSSESSSKFMVQRLPQKSQLELLNCSALFSWNNTRQTSNAEQTLEKWRQVFITITPHLGKVDVRVKSLSKAAFLLTYVNHTHTQNPIQDHVEIFLGIIQNTELNNCKTTESYRKDRATLKCWYHICLSYKIFEICNCSTGWKYYLCT